MGATERRTQVNAKFLSQRDGSFWERVSEGTNNAVPRVLTKGVNEGKTVYEKEYIDISGHLIGVKLETTDFGDMWKLTFIDNGDRFVISYSVDDYDWIGIAERLPNLDLSKKTMFRPYKFSEKEGGRSGISIKQEVDGEWQKINSFYRLYNEQTKQVTYKYNFPNYEEVRNADKDDKKMYWMRVRLFLKKEILRWVENKMEPEIMAIEAKSIESHLGFDKNIEQKKFDHTQYEKKEEFNTPHVHEDYDELPF